MNNPFTNEPATEIIDKNENALVVSNNNRPMNMFSDEGFNIEIDMTTAKTQFCSLKPTTEDESKTLFNAMNNPDKRLSDCIGETINVKHLYIEVVDCVNQETGAVTPSPRIVLIDDKNISYQCVSIGIYSALKKVIQIFGVPSTWKKPIPLKVKQVTKGVRKMLTLAM